MGTTTHGQTDPSGSAVLEEIREKFRLKLSANDYFLYCPTTESQRPDPDDERLARARKYQSSWTLQQP